MKDEWYTLPLDMVHYLIDLEVNGRFIEAADFAERALSGRLIRKDTPIFFNGVQTGNIAHFTDPLDPNFHVKM